MSEINFGKTVSLKQAAKLIISNPETVFMLRGEPGIGKSSLLSYIANETGCDYAYVDVPNLDLGDVAMPSIINWSGATTCTLRCAYHSRSQFPTCSVNSPDSSANQLDPPSPISLLLSGAAPMQSCRNNRIDFMALQANWSIFQIGRHFPLAIE